MVRLKSGELDPYQDDMTLQEWIDELYLENPEFMAMLSEDPEFEYLKPVGEMHRVNDKMEYVPPQKRMRIVQTEPVEKHLQGRHDQKSHGKPGYRIAHQPNAEYGAPGYDLGQIIPDDVYEHPEWYGGEWGAELGPVIRSMRDDPEAEVWIYRAVPNSPDITEINYGDWISLSEGYAKMHGESKLSWTDEYGSEVVSWPEGYKILRKKVRAKDIMFPGDWLPEWGYFPKVKKIWISKKGEWAPGPHAHWKKKIGPNPVTPVGVNPGDEQWGNLTDEQQQKILHERGVPDDQMEEVQADLTRCRGLIDEELAKYPGSTGGEVHLNSKARMVKSDAGAFGYDYVYDANGNKVYDWDVSFSAPYAPDWPDQIPHGAEEFLYPAAVSEEARGGYADAQKFANREQIKRVWMTPEEYLRACDLMFTRQAEQPQSSQWILRDTEGLAKLVERIKAGESMSVPWLDVSVADQALNGQEGRHRAVAAIMAGVKAIPVDLVLRSGERWIDNPELFRRLAINTIPQPERILEKRVWHNRGVGEATPLVFKNQIIGGFADHVIDVLIQKGGRWAPGPDAHWRRIDDPIAGQQRFEGPGMEPTKQPSRVVEETEYEVVAEVGSADPDRIGERERTGGEAKFVRIEGVSREKSDEIEAAYRRAYAETGVEVRVEAHPGRAKPFLLHGVLVDDTDGIYAEYMNPKMKDPDGNPGDGSIHLYTAVWESYPHEYHRYTPGPHHEYGRVTPPMTMSSIFEDPYEGTIIHEMGHRVFWESGVVEADFLQQWETELGIFDGQYTNTTKLHHDLETVMQNFSIYSARNIGETYAELYTLRHSPEWGRVPSKAKKFVEGFLSFKPTLEQFQGLKRYGGR